MKGKTSKIEEEEYNSTDVSGKNQVEQSFYTDGAHTHLLKLLFRGAERDVRIVEITSYYYSRIRCRHTSRQMGSAIPEWYSLTEVQTNFEDFPYLTCTKG